MTTAAQYIKKLPQSQAQVRFPQSADKQNARSTNSLRRPNAMTMLAMSFTLIVEVLRTLQA